MIALALDDEKPMLRTLVTAIKQSEDVETVQEFTACSKALEWVKENSVDVAFLDINMRGMSGLDFAEQLLQIHPDCKIIFCTGYSEYAVDAFKIHVTGYLMKPITVAAVQRELDYIKGVKSRERFLTVKCFGNFEVYYNREPLNFKRSKTKELLAFLVDRKGAGVTARQICATLWEDDIDDGKKQNYFYQLMIDLNNSLKKVVAESVLKKNGTTYLLDVERIDCDYYSYLEVGKPDFRGEYMSQYSWAEETCGMLTRERK